MISKYLEQLKFYKYLGLSINVIIPSREKLKKELIWAVKLIMPIKKYLKAN
jgi:hypothetical protein